MGLSRWHRWLLGVVLTASLSGRAGGFQAEPPPDHSAPGDGPVSPCVWTEESAPRVLARGLGDLSVHDETVSSLAARLQGAYDVPLSFIESDEDVKISFAMSRATVQGALEKIVERAPVYRYATIAGRPVLYPRSAKWDARLEAVRLGPGPRRKVASELTRELQRRLPAFAKFGAIHEGNANSYVFQDEVSVVGTGSVVELLVQLLGARPSAVFSIEKVPLFASPQLYLGGVRYWQAVKLTSPAKVMRPGEKVQLKVMGILPDGTHRDVTPAACLTVYWVTDEKVVTVSADGLVIARGSGEAGVQAENGNQVDVLSIQVAKSPPGTGGASPTSSLGTGAASLERPPSPYGSFPWPEVSGERLLDRPLGPLSFVAKTVWEIVHALIREHHVPLSFVEIDPAATLYDGGRKNLTSGSCATQYSVSNPKVIAVSSDGLVSVRGEGKAIVTATNEHLVGAIFKVTFAGKAKASPGPRSALR